MTVSVSVIWTLFISGVHAIEGTPQNITGLELKKLAFMRNNWCLGTQAASDKSLHDPWFCIHPELCSLHPAAYVHVIISGNYKWNGRPVCLDHEYNNGETVCCNASHITIFEQNAELYQYPKERENLDLAGNPISDDHIIGGSVIEWYMVREFDKIVNKSEFQYTFRSPICGLIPISYKNEFVQYTPMFCAYKSLCDEWINNDRVHKSVRNYAADPAASELCSTRGGAEAMVCCHPAVTYPDIPEATTWNWEFPTLRITSANAQPGFRSSFMCEQYSKLVCNGSVSHCVQPAADSPATPGEFPHQALVGIKEPRLQVFFCAGSIVSRYYILSAAGCTHYEGHNASVALTGEFNLWKWQEEGSSEVLSSIVRHHIEPGAGFPDETKLVLFQLWRPLIFNHLRRPVCINTLLPHPLSSRKARPNHGWFSGYGKQEIGGRWSEYIKKVKVLLTGNGETNPCTEHFKNIFGQPNQTVIFVIYYFCFTKTNAVSPPLDGYAWGPCEFDLGAPITVTADSYSTPEPAEPLCQQKLYAVSVTPVTRACDSENPALFRIMDSSAVLWVEDTIYEYDFYLPDFDLSWHTCLDPHSKFSDYKYLHISRWYDLVYATYKCPPYCL